MIDCDIHPGLRDVKDLVPWLDPAFRDYVLHGGYGGYALPTSPWAAAAGGMPPGDPAADYERMRDRLLDPLDIEYAILTADDILSISAIPNGPLAAALATAYNRWLVAEWLPRDERLKGSLVVAPQEPELAAAEIREVAGHPDVVQVILSCGSAAGYGDARYRPIWAACSEVGLPLALHVGAEGIGVNAPPTSTGHPRSALELRTLLPTTAMSHLVSIVAGGVFQRFPDARLAIVESGVTWLTPLLWRLDASWRSLQGQAAAQELPSETVRRRVRLTSEPLDEPGDRQPWGVLDETAQLGEMLMFASNYPRVNLDRPGDLAPPPGQWEVGVRSENARTFYRLPARAPGGASGG